VKICPYTVTIEADPGVPILGFLVQAWDPSDTRIGYFTLSIGTRYVDCSNFNSIPLSVSEA